jgi:hypothetical protein
LELVDKHLRSRLCGWLHLVCPWLGWHDRARAWADTLVSALRAARAGRFDPRRPLLPWLHEIAYRRAVDQSRRQGRHARALRAAAYDLGRRHDGRLRAGLPPAERCELRQVLDEAVGALPGNQQAVVRVFLDDYPESADLDVLRRALTKAGGPVPTRAGTKRALQEGRAKVRPFLRKKGYVVGG